jgi:hypothetical protein
LESSNGSASTKLQPQIVLFPVPSPSGGGFNDASTFNPTSYPAGTIIIENLPQTSQTGTAMYSIETNELFREGITDSSGNIWAAIITLNAYTPVSAETFNLVPTTILF